MYVILQIITIKSALLNILVSMMVGALIYSVLSGVYFIKIEGYSIGKIRK